jgi:hypothetical protein
MRPTACLERCTPHNPVFLGIGFFLAASHILFGILAHLIPLAISFVSYAAFNLLVVCARSIL